MSPEQARGEGNSIDRRSDVYSLGATLYEVLCGQSPFEGNSGVDVILKLLQEEPEPLRKKNPATPEDLESIVMKCLEKEPSRRYDSSRALAEDLGRFLDAEPVKARPATLAYRFAKKARKNKALVALSGILILLILGFTAFSLRLRWKAAQQASLAQQFGQEIEKMDSTMRYAYLLPLHDIRGEKRMVEHRMKLIEKRMQETGGVALGPGEYALGRGWMSLHEYEKARTHLENAWQINYRAPEVAYALGHTLGVLYHLELENAERLSDQQVRNVRIKEVEKEFRDRAIRFVNESSGVWGESPSFVRAKIAFYQKRYEEALRRADEAWIQVPWLYEAKLLEGEIWTAKGNDLRDRGDTPGAISLYDKAEKAYQEASARASSDNSVYEALCGLSLDRMNLEMYQTGMTIKNNFERALQTCMNAVKTDPESEEAYNNLSMLYFRFAESQMTGGGDPQSNLKKAEEFASESLRWNPRSINAYNNRGRVLRLLSEYETDHGIDPVSHLNEAIQSFQNVIQIDPNNSIAYHQMGNAYWTLSEFQTGHGIDPRPALNQAFRLYQKAASLNPTMAVDYHNNGVAYWTLADYENSHGIDPRNSLRQAISYIRKSIQLNPDYSLAYMNLGGVLESLANYEYVLGLDPLTNCERSIQSFQKALQINPDYSYAHSNLSDVYLMMSIYYLEQKKDPSKWVNLGKQEAQKAIETNPDYFEPYVMSARLLMVEARFQMQRHLSAEQLFRKADEALAQALKLNPKEAETYYTIGDLQHVRADWKWKQGKSAVAEIREGMNAVEKALEYNPDMTHALIIRARLKLQKARSDSVQRKELALSAKDDLLKAFKQNPQLKRLDADALLEAEKLLK